MSQLSLSLDSSLLVRDVTGDYRPANADEVLQAAQRLLGAQLRGREVLSSPQAVRDFLRVKLGGLEHEVFAVLMLDAQNRLIEYVELFRGTVSQASVYPREVVKESLAFNAGVSGISCLAGHNEEEGDSLCYDLRNQRYRTHCLINFWLAATPVRPSIRAGFWIR